MPKGEKAPQFLREFSKEESPDERTQLAREIKGKRKARREEVGSLTERQVKLTGEVEKISESAAEKVKEIEALNKELENLTESGVSRFFNYFQIRKLRADVAIGQKTYEELLQEKNSAAAGVADVSDSLEKHEENPVNEDCRWMLKKFYEEQAEEWRDSDYTKEDIEKYFSEEHLSSLSLEGYRTLLGRFPGEMVAHVTRQGIRDHTGMVYHLAGAGEYVDGFMQMLEDGRLRSPLGVHLAEKEKTDAVAKFLNLSGFKNREEALNYVNEFTDKNTQGDPGSYSDRMAVHFATEEVADSLYGSEKGNEIFIAYPSAYIASQYYFSGQLSRAEGGQWNDQWVWANEEKGMDLNAGLVFIPKDARVDKKTGSRYELDENKNPIVNQKYKDLCKSFIESPKFFEIAQAALDIKGTENREQSKDYSNLKERLKNEFGITDTRMQDALFDYQNLYSLCIYRKKEIETGVEDVFHTTDSAIKGMLEDQGILYKEAEDATKSEIFWEDYFSKHPEQRPSKVVYYEGGDPTKALENWKIGKKAKDKTLGFPERKVERDNAHATSGIERFKSIAVQVIEEYFADK